MRKYYAIIFSIAILIVVCCLVLPMSAEEIVPGEQVAKAIYGTPVIDGLADTVWDDAEIRYLNHVYEDDGITPPTTVRFRSMWDEDYVYFLVDVKDETMGDEAWEKLIYNTKPSDLYKRDSVSFAFSPDYNRNQTTTQVYPAFWYIIGAYGSTANFNSSYVSQNVWISEDNGASKMFAISYYPDPDTGINYGYTIECKVNLKLMHQSINMAAGTKIGFDIYNNNNNRNIQSANRNYGLTWGGSANSYRNDAEKGTIEFVAKDVKFNNSAEELEWNVFPSTDDDTDSSIKLSIDKHTLTLKDNIWMVYFVNSQNIPEDAKRGVLIWDAPQQSYTIDSTTTCGEVTYKGVQEIEGVNYDRYEYKNVAARNMATDYYAVAYVKVGDEVTYSALDKYSVLQYSFNQTQKYADDPAQTKLMVLLESMMDYGAASQIYYDHNVDRLANDTYYQVTVNGGTLADGTTSGLYKEGDSITLTAPTVSGELVFSHWENGAGATVEAEITVGNSNETYTAEYTEAPTVENPFDDDENSILNAVPSCTVKEPDRIIDSGDSAYQIFMDNTTDEVYKSYTATLLQNGFKEESNRTVNNNLLGVYTNYRAAVTVYYTPETKATRIIAEPINNYYVSSAKSYQKVTTPKLTMIGRKISNGNVYLGVVNDYGLMCFLIRLSDGRFVVVDGGITDNAYGSYSRALYEQMSEQAVDKNNITIAAWIFTHSHNDHIGGFCSFARAYSDQVKLESILYNFPSDADSAISNDHVGTYAQFRSSAQSYYPNTPMYKVHTGHVYTIADATVEIFYTHEDYVTADRAIPSTTNWNNTSLIFGFGIAGQKIMFLGDAQEVPNNQTALIFGSALKSDIVQVAHHGGLGGTNAIYKAIDPSVALFTTSDGIIPTYMKTFPANAYLVNELNVVEYYNAHDRITTWELPYTPKSSGFIK